MDAELLLKAVADPTRLRLLSSLMEKPKFVEELAMELNIKLSTASFHLKKLQAVGFVVSEKKQYYQVYTINPVALKLSLFDIVSENRTDSNNAFKSEVIGECFENGKLKSLPVQVKKREVIYSEIIKLFNENKVYSDREANIIIADVYDDFITIKNGLISLGLLTRTSKGLAVASNEARKKCTKKNRTTNKE